MITADQLRAIMPRLINRLRHCLDSPWYAPQVVLARLSVNAATLIWSIIVLSQADVLDRAASSYRWISHYVPEDAIAAFLGSIALAQIICLWPLQLRPRKHGAWGYGLLAFCWGYVTFSLYFSAPILFPTPGSTAPVIFVLALYGFISIPKRKPDGLA